jgi:ferredoxin-NADP reductase
MEEAIFTVYAYEGQDGEITIDIAAEAPLTVIPFDNRHSYRLQLPINVAVAPQEGECALLTIVPGQNELLRVNGRLEQEAKAFKIAPHEVFFQCSAALSRSRIWQQDRRSYWSGKRKFVCTQRKRENPDVTSFILEPCDEAPIGPVLPGQYVTVSMPIASGARQRSYSVSRRTDGKSLRISVRRVGAGGVSDLLHDLVDIGTELLVGVPAGRFVLSSPPARKVVLVSAGVGITPLLPMLDELAREDRGREIWFVHAARDAAHHLFEEEAREIAARAANGGVTLISCYSRPQEGDRCDFTGRLDSEFIAGLLPIKEADFYICGPDTFMTSVRDGLVERGAEAGSIRYEAFQASAGPTLDFSGKNIILESTVTFAKSGKSVVWSPGEGTLLDLALKNDVNVAYSCRFGDCQSCVQKVINGVVDHLGDEVPLLSLNQTLLCLAVPLGDLVLDC